MQPVVVGMWHSASGMSDLVYEGSARLRESRDGMMVEVRIR